MVPKILLTTAIGPFSNMDGASVNDIHASRMTHGQGIFTQRSYYPALPLYILAQNISASSAVLENPTPEFFEQEVRNNYEYIGITFPPIFLDKVHAMCQTIRRISPRTKIILGGYGVFCIEEDVGIGKKIKPLVDHICRGEGVRFLRGILGEPLDRPITEDLPLNQTFLMDQPAAKLFNLASSLGCNNDCEFCSTSAFFGHKKTYLMTPEQLLWQIKKNAASGRAISTWIYDEDFFDPPEYSRELARIMKADREIPKHLINLGTLGSVKSLSKFRVEEFLEMGINHIWVGVESKFSALPKRQGRDIRELFASFHSAGIMTIASFIIGLDCQTPENIEEDIEFFASLNPTFTQITGILPCPGTKLWQNLDLEKRLSDFEQLSWDDYHMYTPLFQPKHFSKKELLPLIKKAYSNSYEKSGPSILRALEIHLNGFENCIASENSIIKQRVAYYETICRQIYPVLLAIREFSPSTEVSQKVDLLRQRMKKHFGKPDLKSRLSSILALFGGGILSIRPKRFERNIHPVNLKRVFPPK
ncbi:MAG: B12-binding domain-containing radical SAM protein [Candidatus Ozemobacteraceae bacterium]